MKLSECYFQRASQRACLFLICIILFTYLFLAVLGLRFCADFSLVAANRGYSLVAGRRLPTGVASLIVEHRL